MKRDGHTHTEYCPHGNGDPAEKMILKAIEQGFTHYSITEHAPMPPEFFDMFPASIREYGVSGVMAMSDLEHYLKNMKQLQEKYKSQIKISVGFEIDFLESFNKWNTDLLNEYGAYLDDGIVSVHLICVNNELHFVDLSPEAVKGDINQYYGSFHEFQSRYYDNVYQSIVTDLGEYKPKRIGHMSLCQKYQKAFDIQPEDFPRETLKPKIMRCLTAIKQQGYELDFNTNGIRAEYCGEFYPGRWTAAAAKHMGIPLVYGSDSHSVEQVGQWYNIYQEVTN